MSQKGSSLQDLKNLREAVLAEEKAKTEALLHNLSQKTGSRTPEQTEGPNSAPVPGHLASVEPAPTLAFASPQAVREPAESVEKPRARRGALSTPSEPALIIPLTPNIQERLHRNVEDARWSQADLVIELIRSCLHRGYPAIRFGDTLLAREGTFRSFERNPLETFLKITSGQGIYNVTVRRENPDLQNWTAYLQNQNAPDPDRSAIQLSLASLQSYLESVEDFQLDGWTKTISEESFLVAPFEVNYT